MALSTRARWAFLGGAIGGFLVCATGFSLLDRRDTAAGTALILGTTLFGVLVHSLVRHQFLTGETVLKWRVAAFGVAIALGVGLVWWWSNAPKAPDGFGLWGGVLVFIGLGLAVAELRRSKWASSRIGGLFAVIAALLLGLSFTLLAFGVTGGVIGMLALGLTLMFVSMSLLSAVCNRKLKTWAPAKAALLLGGGLVLFGAAVAGASAATTVGLDYIGPIALVILVMMIATASRSNGDSAIALIGLLILTAATPTPVPGPRPPADGKPVMVVLGDSFISGEGADHYFEDTNVKERNTCRRAPTAYANRLVEEAPVLPYDLLFVACSGAKAHEVHQSGGKARSAATDEKGLNQVALAQDALANAGVAAAQVPFVLLSIGGNDSLFGDIVQACLAPGDCSTLGSAWRANLQNLVGPLREAYGAVQNSFRGVPILVVPYPVPIARDKGTCDWTTFTPSEHQFLHDFTAEINSVIATTVAESSFTHLHFVDTMPPALIDANLALCAADPNRVGVNFLAVNGVDGLIESSINPTNWIHNSMHPNERGHEAMRRAVQAWLDAHADVRTGQPGAVRRTTTPAAAIGSFAPVDPSGRCVDMVLGPPQGEVTKLKECTGEWTLEETSSFAAFPGVLLLLPLLTAWVVGLAVVRLARIAGAWLWNWGPVAARRQQLGLR